MKNRVSDRSGSRTFGESLERWVGRVVDGAVGAAREAVVAGLLLPLAGGLGGCTKAPPATGEAPEGAATRISALSDWVHDQGQRDTSMVSYTGAWWTQYTDCGYRGGCQGLDVLLKMKVKRVEGANLDQKRIGIYCASPFCLDTGVTAVGHYFGDMGDGYEEWHVPVNRRMWDTGAFAFTAWYQDGKGNTFYDDNEGEQHAVAYRGAPVVLRHDWTETQVSVGDDGVTGRITMVVGKLDFDKDIRMVWTTDAWATVNEARIGEGTMTWHWRDDIAPAFERWELLLDVPGPADRFEYAVVYRHGVVGAAKHYDFWDNNGGLNHVTVKGAYLLPVEGM